MKQFLVLIFMIVCLTLVVEGHRFNGQRGPGRRRHRMRPGPLCKVEAVTGGSVLYEDPDACVFDQECQQSQVEVECDGTPAVFSFCTPKLHFLSGACTINGRNLQRPNCACSDTEYTIRSSASRESVTIRYCDNSAVTDGDDNDDDDDDDADEGDLEDVAERREERPLPGTPSTFSLSSCVRPDRQPPAGKPGRRPSGRRPFGRGH